MILLNIGIRRAGVSIMKRLLSRLRCLPCKTHFHGQALRRCEDPYGCSRRECDYERREGGVLRKDTVIGCLSLECGHNKDIQTNDF
jgi:hypothetical protein